jgi:uncharacterized membrane protein
MPRTEFLRKTAWYWTTVALVIIQNVVLFPQVGVVYSIPYLQLSMGLVFLLFLPGYALTKALFASKIPLNILSEEADSINRFGLSVGLSLALVVFTGLILNFSPWGLNLLSITVTISILTSVIATAALFRES